MASSGLKLKTTDTPNRGKGEVEGNSKISALLPICTVIRQRLPRYLDSNIIPFIWWVPLPSSRIASGRNKILEFEY